MAKNDVNSWSTNADSNTDIAGIDISEGCPPSGINNAIRAIMAQIAVFVANATYTTLTVTGSAILGAASTVKDLYGTARAIGYRNVPSISKTAPYTLTANDVGSGVDTNSQVTVPASVFAAGDIVAVTNVSDASITITAGSGVTMIAAGLPSSQAGNRTLGPNGSATVRFRSASVAVVAGAGVS